MARNAWSVICFSPGRMDLVRVVFALWCRPRSPCYHESVLGERLSRDHLAVAAALLGPLALAAILIPFRASVANTEAALVMLLVVVAVAANGNRLAGYLAALSAAVWFDFFLTRPYQTFRITTRTDIETTVLLLVIGAAVTELAVWGRRQHAAASRRAGYLDGIGVAVEAVAVGVGPSELIEEVSGQLTRVLSLRSCRWQYGVAGLGHPARLKHTGQVVTRGRAWDVAAAGLPPETETELLVENGGLLQGRFLLMPVPGSRPTREQLLVGIALADQVGAALGGSHPAGR
jgi:K+-sensing histidine kinase KdpD